MERTAIDSSGCIGSLYDGLQDCLLESLPVNTSNVSSEMKNITFCELISGDSLNNSNLLQKLGVEFDLRLNILLNSKPRLGIAALTEYPHSINRFTRFLHYTYEHRFEELLDTAKESKDLLKSQKSKTHGTHIVTGVCWGIHVVVALQLPCDFAENSALDDVLRKVQAFLKDNQNAERLCSRDVELLDEIVHTTVYSNIREMESMPTLLTICQYINGRNEQFHSYRPIKYVLKNIGSESNAVRTLSSKMNDLELHLIRLLNKMTELKYSIDHSIAHLLCGHLQDRLSKVQQQWDGFKTVHQNQIKQIEKIVRNIRSELANSQAIDQAFVLLDEKSVSDSIVSLTEDINELESKGQLITSLQEKGFNYCNVADLQLNKTNYAQVLMQKLMPTNRNTQILCSNDTLNRKKQSQMKELREKLCQDKNNNPDLHLIYADFSYCSFELPSIMLLPSNNESRIKRISNDTMPSLTPDNVVNVLLLGETGVGKSTFINAFVNYLAFDTLHQAESNQPVLLIPVSFLITAGDDFEERLVHFGDPTKANTEDFDHPGQSVTQHCKSYLFDLNRIHRKKLRIIDTPGFGDTRGLDQDDKNMQHILQYVNTLSHLNAVCFLLKPNTSRLHVFFRSCLTQLLDLLGPNAHENILFCFTNARSTFYTPGDTAPLLRTILNSVEVQGSISLKKENTFCFDNESFRFLVARQNGIEFDDEQRREYEMSWSTSVRESVRLLRCVNEYLNVYRLSREQQSKKHAEIEIIQMVRPMLEVLRNILRNMVLCESNNENRSIALRPEAVHHLQRKDFSSQAHFIQVGGFLIFQDHLEKNSQQYYQCSFPLDRDCLVEYTLDYEYLSKPSSYTQDQMNETIRQLRRASNIFSYFLMNIVRSTEEDPFLMGLRRMIDEENYLSENKLASHLNKALVANLRKLKFAYERGMNEPDIYQLCNDRSTVYQWIRKVSAHSKIREQLAAIYDSRRVLMEECE